VVVTFGVEVFFNIEEFGFRLILLIVSTSVAFESEDRGDDKGKENKY